MTMIKGHPATEAASNLPVWDIDPYDRAILSDPAEYHSGLRARGRFSETPNIRRWPVGVTMR